MKQNVIVDDKRIYFAEHIWFVKLWFWIELPPKVAI